MMSPIADNLTTALLMATVAMAVGGANTRFVGVACINIVVAANAGGAFSPFGDITTLMVWQKGIVEFQQFFVLFLPSLVNWLIPAFIMSLVVSKAAPDPISEQANLQHGAWVIVGLFLVTISMAVSAHNFLHLPPVHGHDDRPGPAEALSATTSNGAIISSRSRQRKTSVIRR